MGHQQDNLLSLNTLYCLLNCRSRQTFRITRRLAQPPSITANAPHTPHPRRCTFNGHAANVCAFLAQTVTPFKDFESRSVILGPEYVKAGSTINLTCVINQVNMAGMVYWYHNLDILDYEGNVKILTQEDHQGTLSRLIIEQATPKHSGNYTC
ncbi:hypothetical protein O3P69_013306 [Scylla paramamosain]|uniref:Ig-like domain-containing protein n=1 Tax=Scylla paramamosain TaxID=85552 RepID=A0AAW0TZL9_SCYPA